MTLADAEREHILEALQDTKWVLAGPKGAAARLGMGRSTLQWKMKKLRPRPSGIVPAPWHCARSLAPVLWHFATFLGRHLARSKSQAPGMAPLTARHPDDFPFGTGRALASARRGKEPCNRLNSTTHNRLAPSRNGHAEVAYTLDSRIVADLGGTRELDKSDPRSPQPAKPRPRWGRRFVICLVAAAVLWVAYSKGVPFMREVLETVETDDAFVAGHITYVSPRIEDVVTEVLVDQNDRIEPGDLLVKLDREPFEVAVAQAEASLEEARANVVQSRRRSVRRSPGRVGLITKGRTPRRPCGARSPF